jgi:hypothetical protein
MNERIIKLGLESGMLNYVDHETPRHYFLCGYANEKDLEKFAELIVRECADVAGCNGHVSGFALGDLIKEHFGVDE